MFLASLYRNACILFGELFFDITVINSGHGVLRTSAKSLCRDIKHFVSHNISDKCLLEISRFTFIERTRLTGNKIYKQDESNVTIDNVVYQEAFHDDVFRFLIDMFYPPKLTIVENLSVLVENICHYANLLHIFVIARRYEQCTFYLSLDESMKDELPEIIPENVHIIENVKDVLRSHKNIYICETFGEYDCSNISAVIPPSALIVFGSERTGVTQEILTHRNVRGSFKIHSRSCLTERDSDTPLHVLNLSVSILATLGFMF